MSNTTPEIPIASVRPTSQNFKLHTIPDTGYMRLRQIIGDLKSTPPIPPIIPVSSSGWWLGVKSGIYPKPVKLGQRTTAWRVEDIRELIEKINKGEFEGDSNQ